VFYTSDPKAMTRALDAIAERGTLNELQLNVQKDPQWKVLKSIAPRQAA